MATQLKSKPGLSSTTTLSIPKDWDPTWFRHFINNQLKGADVRNAIGAGGITISGNISSPYATINASGLISSVVGTANQIAVTTAGGTATVSFASPPLVLNRAGDGDEFIFQRSGISGLYIGFGDAFVAGAAEIFSANGIQLDIGTDTAASLNFYTNSQQRISIGSSGNVTVNAPGSGYALTVTGLSSAGAILLNSAGGSLPGLQNNSTGAPTLVMNSPGANYGQIGSNGTQTWYLGYGGPTAVGTAVLEWTNTGNIIINGTSSGIALEISTGTNQPLDLTTSSNGPWALTITRSDLSSTIHCFNSGNTWFFNENVICNTGLEVGSATGGLLGSGTVNVSSGYYINGVSVSVSTGTFNAGTTGLSGGTVACSWTKIGGSVTLGTAVISGTSSSTSFGLSGLPTAIQPATSKYAAGPCVGENNSAFVGQIGTIVSGSTLTFLNGAGGSAGWTAANIKQIGDSAHGCTFVWDMS